MNYDPLQFEINFRFSNYVNLYIFFYIKLRYQCKKKKIYINFSSLLKRRFLFAKSKDCFLLKAFIRYKV